MKASDKKRHLIIATALMAGAFVANAPSVLAEHVNPGEHGKDGHANEHEHHHGNDGHANEHEHHHGNDGHANEHEHHHGNESDDDGHHHE
jgi:hypothetical protein